MTETLLAKRVERLGRSAGLDAIGFTGAQVLEPARTVIRARKSRGLAGSMNFTYRNPDRSTDPTRALPGAKTLIAGAVSYYRATPTNPPEVAGRVARYSWRDYYEELRVALEAVALELRSNGYRAQVHCDANSLVDRNVAYRAGLGSYGKNANILLPGAGSWFVLGAVLTDADLGQSAAPQADQCGSCQRCFEGCPTDAIVGPGIVDARRCIAWLVQAGGEIPIEYREAVGDKLYGCDDCQEVCPPNRSSAADTTSMGPPAEADSDPWVPLLWVLEASDEDLLDRIGRWYIAGRDPDVVRRTALVNLGNTGDPGEAEVLQTLDRYLRHHDETLRQHAVWACRRLGLDSLAEPHQTDPSAMIRAEFDVDVVARFGRT